VANRYGRPPTTIRDCTSGFRCFRRRESLEQLPLASIRSDGYSFIVELAWQAAKAGFRRRNPDHVRRARRGVEARQ
jgi:hypothetical protein